MSLRRGALLILLGVVMVAVGVSIALFQAARTFTADDFEVPGSFEQELTEGTWVVFERVDEVVEGGIVNVRASQVTTVEILNGQGAAIEVRPMGETIIEAAEINGAVYEGRARFDVDADGTFTVNVDASGPAVVRVGKSLTQNIALFFLVIVLALGGFIVGVAGFVVGAIAWTRRTPTTPVPAP